MSRSLRATVVAATLLAAATTLLPAPATAEDPPVLDATAALLPAEGLASAVGPDGTTYVVGTTYRIDDLEHSGDGQQYEAFVFAYAPDGTLRDSRYLGGSGNDYGHAVTTTADGSVVVTGSTLSTDFPTTAGNAGTGDQGGSDGYVTVLSADLATIEASAMFGGSGSENPVGVAVDGDGLVWVSAWTDSLSLPVTTGPSMTLGGKDAVVLAFGPALTTRPVTRRIGGGDYEDTSEIVGLPAGGAIVVGRTTSGADFPAVGPGVGGVNGPLGAPGGLDAFAAKVTGSGEIAWSTRFGTADADEAQGVALDPAGRVVIAGQTSSTSFPATTQYGPQEAGVWHSYLLTLAASGDAIVQSTVVGGSGGSVRFEDVAVDAAGDLYVVGSAKATSLPLAHQLPAQGGALDIYALKLSATGSQLHWATAIGTSADEEVHGISLDPHGTVTVVGRAAAAGYPGASPSPVASVSTPGLVVRLRSTPHVTAITGAATTGDRTPTLGFTVDVAGARTECRVDGAAWAPCDPSAPDATTYTTPELALGAHSVEVRASDFPGVYGPVAQASVTVADPPASAATAAVDTVAPNTAISKHPKKRTTKAKVRFAFTSEPGATFACKLDRRAWRTCRPTHVVKVKTGRHTLRVRATDAAGNTDATPARFRWRRV